MSEISINDATFSYDGRTDIFTDLSCTIYDGEIFCILGPNGIGKSTLLKGIMNLLKLKKGSVTLDGRDIRAIPPKILAKHIAYIPQTYHMMFPYRVMDVIMLGRTPHLNRMSKPTAIDYQKVEEAIEGLGLQELAFRSCTQLSGGQLQLVMLARAIAQEATFLMLDEPTAHLDFGKQLKTLEMVETMKKKGVGVIITTHNPDHAFLIADKVAIMNHRTFVAVGNPNDVITEENLRDIYDVDVRIRNVFQHLERKVCVPMRKNDVF